MIFNRTLRTALAALIAIWLFGGTSSAGTGDRNAPPTPAAGVDGSPPSSGPRAQQACKGGKIKVAVDIGHTPREWGTWTARGGREFDLNERFARELVAMSAAHTDLALFLIDPEARGLGLKRRPQLAAEMGADVFLSIHHDSAQKHLLEPVQHKGKTILQTRKIRGFSVFVSRENRAFAKSRRLASEIASAWVGLGRVPTLHHAEPIKGENRDLLDPRLGLYEAPFAVVRHAKIPAVLVEVGVVVNPDEEEHLEKVEVRQSLQSAMLEALKVYCQLDGR